MLGIRRAYSTLALGLVAEGKKDSALQVLNYGYKMIDPTTLPYGAVSGQGSFNNAISLQYIYAYYMAGDIKKADMISSEVMTDCQQQLAYYDSVPSDSQPIFQQDQQTATEMLKQLQEFKTEFSHPAK